MVATDVASRGLDVKGTFYNQFEIYKNSKKIDIFKGGVGYATF